MLLQRLRPHLAPPALAAARTRTHSSSSSRTRTPVTPVAAEMQPPRATQVLATAQASAEHGSAGSRLDAALPLLFPDRWPSQTAAKRAVRRGEVQVNGSSATTDLQLRPGDEVAIVTPVGCARQQRQHQQHPGGPETPGLECAYEDDHLAVVIKPQGLVTQGPKGPASVVGRIKTCLQPTPLPGALYNPAVVHRLDVGTGGLLLAAKTRAAAVQLSADLAEHKMQKRYLALVLGRMEGSGCIDFPIDQRPARSLYAVVHSAPSASFGALSVLSLWPQTGRTHQLRKHVAYIGHPILGDAQYKHHRKAECRLTPLADLQQELPPFCGDWRQAHAAQQAQLQAALAEAQQQQQQQQQQQHSGEAAAAPDVVWNGARLVAMDGGQAGGGAQQHTESGSSDGRVVGGVKQRVELLADGRRVGTCLWAVQLQLRHPCSSARELLDVAVGDAAVRAFAAVLAREAAAAATGQS